MEENQRFKEFFIDDEQTFKKEQIQSLIEKCMKFSKIVGKEGKVHIVKRGLNFTNRAKLFLITRYLGNELTKLDPSIGIKKGIDKVSNSELSEFLAVSKPYARALISHLVDEGFAKRPDKGYVFVVPYKIDDFLGLLEKEKNYKTIMKWKKNFSKTTRKKEKQKEEKQEIINVEEVYTTLSNYLGIYASDLKDSIFINEDGSFKFNKNIPGKSKNEKQANCILCAACIETVGLRKTTFSSKKIIDVCYNSNIDKSGINQAIKYLKDFCYISKASKGSQENIILEKGKSRAKDIFNKICK